MIGVILSDPVFQFGIFGTMVGTIALLLALRSQVESHPVAVVRGTRLVLTLSVLSVLLVSGWSGWHALSAQGQSSTGPTSAASSPGTRASPSAEPLATPTEVPSPTPTPHLSRSITQVLTTFCQEITARDYSTAWNVFAAGWQHRHTYAATVTDWRRYSACSVSEQGGDPDAISALTFTLAPGEKDQYGFAGDTSLHFAMIIQAQAWKITSVCHQIAEGCFPLVWG